MMQLDEFMWILENVVQSHFFFVGIILLALSNGLCIENILVLQQKIDHLREHPLPEVSLKL